MDCLSSLVSFPDAISMSNAAVLLPPPSEYDLTFVALSEMVNTFQSKVDVKIMLQEFSKSESIYDIASVVFTKINEAMRNTKGQAFLLATSDSEKIQVNNQDNVNSLALHIVTKKFASSNYFGDIKLLLQAIRLRTAPACLIFLADLMKSPMTRGELTMAPVVSVVLDSFSTNVQEMIHKKRFS